MGGICLVYHFFLISLFYFTGGIGAGQAQGGEVTQDRDGIRHGRDPQGGDQGVQGDPHLPFVQSEAKGRCLDQMLPLFLLRLPSNPLRNEATEMSQVQCCFWRQRLSSPLFGLIFLYPVPVQLGLDLFSNHHHHHFKESNNIIIVL